ncbi:hypothetical protein NDU88_008079 [Pleurodeles waltl]|uniref:Uncharacterized protein n=1 Tax=Pleurodeles waltl TaxID=8319 RepID=A0AAV7U1P8_PLEWA|nr:hypothetical protein NDU88_008079 [Pleurodeles waltl]
MQAGKGGSPRGSHHLGKGEGLLGVTPALEFRSFRSWGLRLHSLYQASGSGKQEVAVRGSLGIPSAGVAVGATLATQSRSRRGVLPEVLFLHKSSRGRRVQSSKSHASGGKRSCLEVASLETKLQSWVNRAAVLRSFLVLLEQGSPLRIQRSLVLGKASLEQCLLEVGRQAGRAGAKAVGVSVFSAGFFSSAVLFFLGCRNLVS